MLLINSQKLNTINVLMPNRIDCHRQCYLYTHPRSNLISRSSPVAQQNVAIFLLCFAIDNVTKYQQSKFSSFCTLNFFLFGCNAINGDLRRKNFLSNVSDAPHTIRSANRQKKLLFLSHFMCSNTAPLICIYIVHKMYRASSSTWFCSWLFLLFFSRSLCCIAMQLSFSV